MEASVADVCTFEGAMRVESATRESYERHRADDDVRQVKFSVLAADALLSCSFCLFFNCMCVLLILNMLIYSTGTFHTVNIAGNS